MHYRNGREAKNGDRVVQFTIDGGLVTAVGILENATPGNDYCNGNILSTQQPSITACLCDCLRADDVAAIIKNAGLDNRPPGK